MATLKVRIVRPCLVGGQHTPAGAAVTVGADSAQVLTDCGTGLLLDPADAAVARAGQREAALNAVSRERDLAQAPIDGPWRRSN